MKTKDMLPIFEGLTFHKIFSQNISLMAAGIPDILSAHHAVLRHDVTIPKKSHQELKNYKQPVSISLLVTFFLDIFNFVASCRNF